LYEGLSPELKDTLVTLDTPDELDQYIILLKRVDHRIRARSAERKRSSSTWRLPTTTTTTTPKPPAPPTTTTTATGTQAAPWTFLLDNAAYHKHKVKIAFDAANASTVGELTTWLDNVRTD